MGKLAFLLVWTKTLIHKLTTKLWFFLVGVLIFRSVTGGNRLFSWKRSCTVFVLISMIFKTSEHSSVQHVICNDKIFLNLINYFLQILLILFYRYLISLNIFNKIYLTNLIKMQWNILRTMNAFYFFYIYFWFTEVWYNLV